MLVTTSSLPLTRFASPEEMSVAVDGVRGSAGLDGCVPQALSSSRESVSARIPAAVDFFMVTSQKLAVMTASFA